MKSKPIRKIQETTSPFTLPRSSQWPDESLTHGTVKGENKQVCLLESKPGADPVVDGSELLNSSVEWCSETVSEGYEFVVLSGAAIMFLSTIKYLYAVVP